jgi:ubiquinone/menaquinone biosynthesis C-methylase UbiE
MHRVLKPGGRAVIMDLRKEASVPDMRAYITKAGYGWFDAWLMRLIFRFLLLPRAYTKAQVTQMAARSRFGRAAMHEVDIGFEIVLTKERASL